MYVVADEVEAAPPATADNESTRSGLRMSSMRPFSSR
jgi:hypothetical protein